MVCRQKASVSNCVDYNENALAMGEKLLSRKSIV